MTEQGLRLGAGSRAGSGARAEVGAEVGVGAGAGTGFALIEVDAPYLVKAFIFPLLSVKVFIFRCSLYFLLALFSARHALFRLVTLARKPKWNNRPENTACLMLMFTECQNQPQR